MTATGYDSGGNPIDAGTERRGNGHPPRYDAEIGKPLGVLFREVLDKTRSLLREELRLAKAEMREQLALVGRNAVWISVGAVLLLASILVLCIAVSRGLTVILAQFFAPEIAAWLAPLLLGLALAAIGAILITRGVHALRDHLNLVPEKTKQTLKEDKEWLRQKVT